MTKHVLINILVALHHSLLRIRGLNVIMDTYLSEKEITLFTYIQFVLILLLACREIYEIKTTFIYCFQNHTA